MYMDIHANFKKEGFIMRKVLSLTLALVLVLGLLSFGASASAEDAKLLVWVSNALVPDTDQKLPQEEWTISKIATQFEQQNPGVKVEIVLFSDGIAMMQTFKAASTGADGPDIVNVWAGQQLFEMKDIVVDIKDKIPQDDKDKILGWDIMTLDFTAGNPILAYPASGNEVCGFLYNKQVLAACGLDYDANPPKTVEQFEKDMETIKTAGYLPIVAGDGGWGEALFVAYASWWVQASGSERVASDSKGLTKYADDQGFLTAVQTGADLYAKGYVNIDYATIQNPIDVFLEGNSALIATGNWNTSAAIEGLGEENVGFLNPPDISGDVMVKDTCIGGPGQALVVSKSSPNQDLAIQFLSFLSNKENMTAMNKANSKMALRTDIDAADLGIKDTGAFYQEYQAAMNYVFWADNSTMPDVNAEIQKQSSLVLTGKMSVADFAAMLDNKAAGK
ncbi:MAG: extracellular solute-binding protein [Eubacteriales bacterium]|nr:extracellular solute-binding protein [Eubacteriales bacterium]